MRILLPEQIPVRWMAPFALLMFVVQIWEGTNFVFAMLHFAFLVLWAITFNLAGGFGRISGAYVFWYGLLTVPVGTFIKMLTNDPADSNCWTPNLSMALYVVSMVLLCGSVVVAQRLTSGGRSFSEVLEQARPIRYREGAIGLFVFGMVLPFSYMVLPFGLYQTLSILNSALPFAVIMATIYVVRSSGYRRTIGLVNALPMGLIFIEGLEGFTKLGMLFPGFAWLLAVAYTQFRLRLVHVVAIAFMAWYSVYALAPVAQAGRNLVSDGASAVQRLSIGINLLVNIGDTRAHHLQAESDLYSQGHEYFTKQVDLFWVRMTRFPPDDQLISFTAQGHILGWAGVRWNLINLIPHIIMPNKDQYAVEASTGNYYAREVGILKAADTTTGISFSPLSEAFHIGGWVGVLLFLPALWIVVLSLLELVCGDLRRTPWGLILAVYLSHVAPESGVDGLIEFITVGNLGMIFTVLLASIVAPLIGSVFAGETANPAPDLPLRQATT